MTFNEKKRKKSFLENVRYEYMVAGLSGGVVSTAILHPFDLIKIRFQVNDGSGTIKNRQSYNGIMDAVRSITRTNGIKGLYQGVSPNLAGAGSSWGLYFFSFNFCKASLKDYQQLETLSATSHLLAGTIAGVFTLSLTNPIWVIKTRMCLQTGATSANEVYYSGVLDGLKKLYQQEGLRGYYRGFVPGLFGVSHGALQFMAYEELKKMRSKYTGQPAESKLNPLEYIAMAALSKVFAVVSTYPYQVLRSRLQDAQYLGHYNGMVDTFQKILRHEGVSGLYKGMFMSMLRVTPACCITFLVYENVSHFLLEKN